MEAIKIILGILALVLCIGGIGVMIWILLFGLPQGSMDGGTFVYQLLGGGELI